MSEVGSLPNGTVQGAPPATVHGERRKELEQRANVVRSRLASRLDELGEREERARSMLRALTTPPVSVILIAGAAVALTLTVAVRRRRRPQGLAWLAEQLQPARPKEDGLLKATFKRGVYSLLAFGLRHLAREGIARLEEAAGRAASEGQGGVPPAPVHTPPRP